MKIRNWGALRSSAGSVGGARWMGAAAVVLGSLLIAWPASATPIQIPASVPIGNVVVGHQSIVVGEAPSVGLATLHEAVHRAGTTVHVWTRGFQVQIDQCRGAVDVTAHYGPRTIAEHWSCGGRSFPTTKGALVTITGLDAGTYRVIGVAALLNVHTATTRDLPRGYPLLFQTCRDGNASTTEFIALQAD